MKALPTSGVQLRRTISGVRAYRVSGSRTTSVARRLNGIQPTGDRNGDVRWLSDRAPGADEARSRLRMVAESLQARSQGCASNPAWPDAAKEAAAPTSITRCRWPWPLAVPPCVARGAAASPSRVRRGRGAWVAGVFRATLEVTAWGDEHLESSWPCPSVLVSVLARSAMLASDRRDVDWSWELHR